MKLSDRQREVLERMAQGRELFIRLRPSEAGMQERCWIGAAELPPMTVNALIAARLVKRDRARTVSGLIASYVVSPARQAALAVPCGAPPFFRPSGGGGHEMAPLPDPREHHVQVALQGVERGLPFTSSPRFTHT